MAKLMQDEQEFSILINGRDNSVAEVFSDLPIWNRRMQKRFKPYEVKGDSCFYKVPTRKIVRLAFLTSGDGSNDLSLDVEDGEDEN